MTVRSHWQGLHTDAVWQVTERAVRVGCGFLISVLMARTLGPVPFGTYNYALSFVALFAFLGQAGLETLLLRELVRRPADDASIVSGGLALRALGAALGAVASVAVAVAATRNDTQVPLLAAILSLAGILQAGWIVDSVLQAHRQFGTAARAKIAAYSAATVLRLAALFWLPSLLVLAWITVAESLLVVVLLTLAARRALPEDRFRFAPPETKQLIDLAKLAAPMLLSSLTIAIYSRIDVFLLGKLVGAEATGQYSAAMLLSEGFYIIPTAVMAAAAPRLSSIFLTDRQGFDSSLSRLVRLLSVSGLLIALGVTLLAPIVVPLVFGAPYVAAVKMLQIHIWSTWMVFVSSASDPWYLNHDMRRLYLTKTTGAAVINVALNLVLIPRWDGVGAAVATLISYGFSALGFGLISPATRGLARIQARAMLGLSPGR